MVLWLWFAIQVMASDAAPADSLARAWLVQAIDNNCREAVGVAPNRWSPGARDALLSIGGLGERPPKGVDVWDQLERDMFMHRIATSTPEDFAERYDQMTASDVAWMHTLALRCFAGEAEPVRWEHAPPLAVLVQRSQLAVRLQFQYPMVTPMDRGWTLPLGELLTLSGGDSMSWYGARVRSESGVTSVGDLAMRSGAEAATRLGNDTAEPGDLRKVEELLVLLVGVVGTQDDTVLGTLALLSAEYEKRGLKGAEQLANVCLHTSAMASSKTAADDPNAWFAFPAPDMVESDENEQILRLYLLSRMAHLTTKEVFSLGSEAAMDQLSRHTSLLESIGATSEVLQHTADVPKAFEVAFDRRVGKTTGNALWHEGWKIHAKDALLRRSQLLPDGGGDDPALFQLEQLAAYSSLQWTLARTRARKSVENDDLKALLRSREEHLRDADRFQRCLEGAADRSRTCGLTIPQLVTANESALGDLAIVDAELRRSWPDALQASVPNRSSVAEVQGRLLPNESLVMVTSLEQGTVVTLVTASAVKRQVSSMTAEELERRVIRLRKGLAPQQGGVLATEFPVEDAAFLYAELWEPLAAGIEPNSLVYWRPDGALAAIPPTVLRDKSGRWLVSRHSFVVVPTLEAVGAKRATADSLVPADFLGVGAPNFGGSSERALRSQPLASEDGASGVQFDLNESVVSLAALPETAEELSVFQSLSKGETKQILTGAQATEERVVASLGARPWGTVAFATHGLLSNETPGLFEPALVLTAGTDSDGFLTASEISELKIDAQLLIMSACNTAAGDGSPRASSLSGLSSAFFEAGAQTLLASHWAVWSGTTVTLTTSMFEHLANNRSLDVAQALRLAQIGMIEGGDAQESHPTAWAPFVVVQGADRVEEP